MLDSSAIRRDNALYERYSMIFNAAGKDGSGIASCGNWHVVQYLRVVRTSNVMPLDANGRRSKVPKLKWSGVPERGHPAGRTLRSQFDDPWSNPSGIGVICGLTSGNLEVLDFDGWQLLWTGPDRVEDGDRGPDFRDEHPDRDHAERRASLLLPLPRHRGPTTSSPIATRSCIQIETRGQGRDGGHARLPATDPSQRQVLQARQRLV